MEKEIKEILLNQLKRLSFLTGAELMNIELEDMANLSAAMVEIARLLLEPDAADIENMIYKQFEECLAHE